MTMSKVLEKCFKGMKMCNSRGYLDGGNDVRARGVLIGMVEFELCGNESGCQPKGRKKNSSKLKEQALCFFGFTA